MALVFNPFTGNFDNIIASSSEMSMSDGTLTVNGDINLDDGGAFSTTVQAVTPTANRTISFPDATGTVALVNGANGTIQYNDAGTLKGNSDFTVDLDWNDASTVFTGLKLNVTDGAGGSPVSAAGSSLLDLQVNGASIFSNTLTTTRIGNSANNLFVNHDASSSVVEFRAGGAIFTKIINGSLRQGSGSQISWSANGFNNVDSNLDIALVRDSAGVVKITDGSTGDGTISAQLRAVGTAPATASATGTAGDIRYDADYIYVCTATDTWKRAALATW